MDSIFKFFDGVVDREEDGLRLANRWLCRLTEKLTSDIEMMFNPPINDAPVDKEKNPLPETDDERMFREKGNIAASVMTAKATLNALKEFREVLEVPEFKSINGHRSGLTDLELLQVWTDFQIFLNTEKKNTELEVSSIPSTVA